MNIPALIIDADDTLWDNNIYYEQTNDAFADLMEREGFSRDAARRILSQVEHERVPLVGYGPHEYVRSIKIAYQRLCEQHGRQPLTQVEAEVEVIAHRVLEYPIVPFEGVKETLESLQDGFRLILLTKGDVEIQQDKVRRSKLGHYFEAVHVVAEKGAEVLLRVLEEHDLSHESTWMVGNSPRSDINPALEAGIGAIYIPYAMNWEYEEAPLADPERVTTLERFADLPELFKEMENDRCPRH